MKMEGEEQYNIINIETQLGVIFYNLKAYFAINLKI